MRSSPKILNVCMVESATIDLGWGGPLTAEKNSRPRKAERTEEFALAHPHCLVPSKVQGPGKSKNHAV